MSIDAYTEFLKYNYNEVGKDLDADATPQDYLEYLHFLWKKLSPNEQREYEIYRRELLKLPTGGRNDDEEEEVEQPGQFRRGRHKLPPSAYSMFIRENFPIWVRQQFPQGIPRRLLRTARGDFDRWAQPIWKNLTDEELEYYEKLAEQETEKLRRTSMRNVPTQAMLSRTLEREWYPGWVASFRTQGGPEQPHTRAQFDQYVDQTWTNLTTEEKEYYRDLAVRQEGERD